MCSYLDSKVKYISYFQTLLLVKWVYFTGETTTCALNFFRVAANFLSKFFSFERTF